MMETEKQNNKIVAPAALQLQTKSRSQILSTLLSKLLWSVSYRLAQYDIKYV